MSHPARGAWIEIPDTKALYDALESHPARGAWIEISAGWKNRGRARVAPRKGCVD